MSKNKNTKLFLAGTMAVSSVLVAAPAFAETEAAVPEIEKAAEQLAKQYMALTDEQRTMLAIVQKNIAGELSLFIDEEYEHKAALVKDLGALLQPTDATTEAGVKAEAIARANEFLENAQPYLAKEGELADMVDFANALRTDLYDEVKNVNPNDLAPLIQKALTSFRENAPESVKAIVVMPSTQDAAELIDAIQADIDAALGGGGGTAPGVQNGVLTVTEDQVEKSAPAVLKAIQGASSINELLITTTSEPAEVTVPFVIFNALAEKNEDAVITVQSTVGTITVPLFTVDGESIAEELEVTSPELQMTFSIARIKNQVSGALDIAATYGVEVGTESKMVPFANFGYPIERTIQTPKALDAATTVGLHVFPDGTTKAVPTYVVDNDTVKMNFAELEAHTLISYSKTFADVNKIDAGKYWGKEYIDKLASRMIVSGKTEDSFSPSTTITRGEFAAILSRGLGLRPADFHGETAAAFTDVSLDQAVNRDGEIYAAFEAGIISGYGDGKFGPYDAITRNEAAIMISRAMDFIGEDVDMDGSKNVSQFADYRYISKQARPYVDTVYKAGYLSGFKDNTFRPQNNATRAEMSRILYNFLESIEFIN